MAAVVTPHVPRPRSVPVEVVLAAAQHHVVRDEVTVREITVDVLENRDAIRRTVLDHIARDNYVRGRVQLYTHDVREDDVPAHQTGAIFNSDSGASEEKVVVHSDA